MVACGQADMYARKAACGASDLRNEQFSTELVDNFGETWCMSRITLEFDRGAGWELRHENEAETTPEQAIAELPWYCGQYPHRVLIDGRLIAEVREPRYSRSEVIRH